MNAWLIEMRDRAYAAEARGSSFEVTLDEWEQLKEASPGDYPSGWMPDSGDVPTVFFGVPVVISASQEDH